MNCYGKRKGLHFLQLAHMCVTSAFIERLTVGMRPGTKRGLKCESELSLQKKKKKMLQNLLYQHLLYQTVRDICYVYTSKRHLYGNGL